MSKESLKRQIIYLRAQIEKERESAKRDNAHYASAIKSTSSPAIKAQHRQSKVSASERHKQNIEGYKRQIENYKDQLKRLK